MAEAAHYPLVPSCVACEWGGYSMSFFNIDMKLGGVRRWILIRQLIIHSQPDMYHIWIAISPWYLPR